MEEESMLCQPRLVGYEQEQNEGVICVQDYLSIVDLHTGKYTLCEYAIIFQFFSVLTKKQYDTINRSYI